MQTTSSVVVFVTRCASEKAEIASNVDTEHLRLRGRFNATTVKYEATEADGAATINVINNQPFMSSFHGNFELDILQCPCLALRTCDQSA